MVSNLTTDTVVLDAASHDQRSGPSFAAEAERRRTFAIISHPDAGKTTLTEKLLLYGGAVQLAGSVTARRSQRHAASDWMAIERERGISISSTVLAFPYHDYQVNLLDTPGHQDFSEDTYRTLTAVDSAVMVLDAARGIEPQTLKLFDVCKMRKTPIFTFINKLDRPSRSPLDLLDEIERVLGMKTTPLNWPIGDGVDFRGLYDLGSRTVHLFERTEHGAKRAPVMLAALEDRALDGAIGAERAARLREEVELLEMAGTPFDLERVLAGELTPVCFGSALTNFGVELFLEHFVRHAPAPGDRETSDTIVSPEAPEFSGFVFKIQANMDPRHRDRVAFLRVCSGRFAREMEVWHPRLKRKVRLAPPLRLFGQDREVLEEAYAGDVVGVINPGVFAIGDTVSESNVGTFPPLPRFQPEHFAQLQVRADRPLQAVPEGTDADRGRGCDSALLPGCERPPGADPGGGRRAAIRRGAGATGVRVQRRNDSGAAHVQRGALGRRRFRRNREHWRRARSVARRGPARRSGDLILDHMGSALRGGERGGRRILGNAH